MQEGKKKKNISLSTPMKIVKYDIGYIIQFTTFLPFGTRNETFSK